MTKDHALFFTFDGPRDGREAQAMEGFNSQMQFWAKRKEAGDIASHEVVMLASTRNAAMPAGFLLVTGERSKLQEIRWGDEEFLNLHTTMMMSMNGYACIDGYAGAGFEQHMARLAKQMNS